MTLDYLPDEYNPSDDEEPRRLWRGFQMNEKFISAWGCNHQLGLWSRRTLRPLVADKVPMIALLLLWILFWQHVPRPCVGNLLCFRMTLLKAYASFSATYWILELSINFPGITWWWVVSLQAVMNTTSSTSKSWTSTLNPEEWNHQW